MGLSTQFVQNTDAPFPGQALSDEFVPARPIYFIVIPSILLSGGTASWLLGGDSGLVLGSAIAAAIALFTLWEWLFRHAPTRFSTLLGMSLLLGYGAGALNTWVTLPRTSLTLGEIMGVGQGALTRCIAAVLFSAAPLYACGEIFEKPLFGRGFRLQITESTRSLVYWGTACILLGYATHSLQFSGASSAAGHVSIAGIFLAWFYPPITALALAAFLTSTRGTERILCALCALVLLAMFAVNGRRASLYTTVEILFMLSMVGYQWRGKRIRMVFVLLALGGVITASGLLFMIMRIAPSMGPSRSVNSVSQRVEAASKFVQRSDALETAIQVTRKNAQTRTFILAFLANILDASTRTTPAMGRDAISFLESTIPSAIDPNKDRTFSEEALVDQQFGYGYGDQANSVLTGGATDFGFVGMLLYPILLIMLARIIYGFLSRLLKPLPLLIVTLAFIFLFLQTEITLSGYFADFRNALLFGLVLQLFLAIPRLRPNPEEAGGWR